MCTPELAVVVAHDAELLSLRSGHSLQLLRVVRPRTVPLALAPWIAQTNQLHAPVIRELALCIVCGNTSYIL